MKRIVTTLLLLLFIVPTQAVLNESDLVKTLEVLRDELKLLYDEMNEQLVRYKQYNDMQHDMMLDMIQKSNQTALILYSQKQDYIFNLTYACNEATELYKTFTQRKQPYFNILERLDDEIERYGKLIEALAALPPRVEMPQIDSVATHNVFESTIEQHATIVDTPDEEIAIRDSISTALVDSLLNTVSTTHNRRKNFLLTPAQQAVRDSCVFIALQIRENIAAIHDNVKEDYEQYIAISDKLKKLNDYAVEKYRAIQQNIFKNGETNFVSMLMRFDYYWGVAQRDIEEKYMLTGKEKVRSDWKGPVVIAFTFFALFYLAIAIVLCNIIIRFVVPKRFKNQQFELRKNYSITALSMVLFSIVLIIMSHFMTDNFFKMASGLLIEFTLLMSAIVASLLFRTQADKLRYGYRLYLPIMAMGFFVIFVRIVFLPNSVVSLLFPPILLIVTLFQFTGVNKYSNLVNTADKFYTWISFATILISCIASWYGFTLLAVQIFMWWMIQLTCIHGITCCYDAMKVYEDKIFCESLKGKLNSESEVKKVITSYHAHDGKYFKYTWFGDLLNMTIIPVLAVMSLPLSIYWASKIFDMSEACATIFFTDFIKIPDVFELSISKIVTVSGLYFIFKYLNYMLRAAYHLHLDAKHDSNKQANITLGNNIISIVVWGAFFVIALVLMNVPSSGISIVTAGLATGVGFAMKDVLNNFFYGISLMAGRVRVGEMIECDGIRGVVHSIAYQSTQIQTLDGSIIAFLNSNLFAKSFKNLTRNHDYEFMKLPIGVAYGTNVARVRELLLDRINAYIETQDTKQPDIDASRGVNVMFNGFGDSSVDLYVSFWGRITSKLKICSKINEIIYDTFNDNNIEIPFPQRDVHLKGTL